jgi:ubiquinone/menaquinone biosynthesis C-methylase UbiE
MAPARDKGYKGLGMEGFLARWYARNTGKSMEPFRKAAQMVADQLPGGGAVLEVAPGPGYFAIELAKLGGYHVTGLDISKTFVAIAMKNAAAAGVTVSFQQGNASAMPFGPDSFEFVFCRAAFKNFSAPVEAIREMHRVLKPGGKAVIADLRKNASRVGIRAEVKEMGLNRLSGWLTQFILLRLLKRAYAPEDMQRMAAETPFGGCEIECDQIGMRVTLTKRV